MNRVEVVALLAYAGLRDGRKADDDVAEAWFEDVGDLPFEDCMEAARQHFKDSTEYLMPVHIRATVRTIRAERVRAAGDISDRIPAHIEALEGDEHTRQSLAWLQEAKRRIGDGEPLDVVAPRPRTVPTDISAVQRMKEITEKLARDKTVTDEDCG